MATLMETRTLDQELQERIARHTSVHPPGAENRHDAVTGSDGPIDEDRELFAEIEALLRLARPELDGDEEGAIHRLLDALENEPAGVF